MTQLSESHVKNLLAVIKDPYSGNDLVSLGWIRGIGLDGPRVSIDLRAGYPLDGVRDSVAAAIRDALESDGQIEKATVNLEWKVVPHKVQSDLKPQDQIRNIIAVASAKAASASRPPQ